MRSGSRRTGRDLLRYGATVGLGLVVDIAAAVLALLSGAALVVATCIGFGAGAICNFILMRLWVFATADITRSGPSWALGYAGVVAAILATRVSVAALASAVFGPALQDGVVLAAAIAASFCVGFILSRKLFTAT